MTEPAADETILEDEQNVAPHDRVWPRPWMGPFLHALSRIPDVTSACRLARVGRRTVYDARDGTPERPGHSARPPVEGFADAWDEAVAAAHDFIQQQAHRWITTGVPIKSSKTVTRKKIDAAGTVLETTTETTETEGAERSAVLMIFWLKAWYPERYRWSERTEVVGADGGAIQVESISRLDAQIAELDAELKARSEGQPVPQE